MAIRKLKARGIGRFELLNWLNEFLETDYTKIEHLADGIAYCQVFDVVFPGKVALHHVNFHAQYEPEYERNFRILKKVFDMCQVRKEIPIKKLVKGVFHEHFDFLNWVHDYVHRTCLDAGKNYHGYARREAILSQHPKAAELNVNLVPKFSMRNGLLKTSGLHLDEPFLCDNNAQLAQDAIVIPTPSLPPSHKAQEACNAILHGLSQSKRRSSVKKWEATTWSNQLQQLNDALEQQLHGRIQALDNYQRDISLLLTERKQYWDILRDIEESLALTSETSLREAVQHIVAEPLPEMVYHERTNQ